MDIRSGRGLEKIRRQGWAGNTVRLRRTQKDSAKQTDGLSLLISGCMQILITAPIGCEAKPYSVILKHSPKLWIATKIR